MERLKKIMGNNSGVAVIEIILILVVLIALVIIFKDQAVALVNRIWSSINKGAGDIIMHISYEIKGCI